MRLIENKKVELSGVTLWLRITNKAMIEYEEMTGESWPSFGTIKSRLQYLYCISKAGALAEGQPFEYDYDAFFTLMDDYYFEVNGEILAIIIGMMPKSDEKATGKKK